MPELWESTSVMESCGWEFLLPLNAARHVPLPGIQERRKPWWTDICNGPGGRKVGGYGVMCDVPWRVGTAPCEACKARHALQWTTGTYRLHARIPGVGGRCQEQASTWVAPSVRQDSQHGQQPLGHLSNLLFSSAAGECSERTMDKPSNLGSYPTPMKPAAPLVMPLHLVSYSSQYTKPVEQVLREALRKGGPKR